MNSIIFNTSNHLDGELARFFRPSNPFFEKSPDVDIPQSTIVYEDFFSYPCKLPCDLLHYLSASVVKVALVAIAPLTVIGELYRACTGDISTSACLVNVCCIPFNMVIETISLGSAANDFIENISKNVGFLVWHAGERSVRILTGSNNTVLSNDNRLRDVVYNSLGITLLAASAFLFSVPAIQIFALPIIMGSLFGTINNLFTITRCPEYYTVGHIFDGESLIKTNNLWIKSFVTACCETTGTTKYIGLALSAATLLPFASTTLPIALSASLVGGVMAISLLASHLFAQMRKTSIQTALNEYAELLGFEWDETMLSKRWSEIEELHRERIQEKQRTLSDSPEELLTFTTKIKKISETIPFDDSLCAPTIKYLAAWSANRACDLARKITAVAGTIALITTTIFLRTHVL